MFGFGKKKEICSCSKNYTTKVTEKGSIKVLGGGCPKCHELEANTKAALSELGIMENVELITDFSVIVAYGVISTPVLVIDDKVVSYGKVLNKKEVLAAIMRTRS